MSEHTTITDAEQPARFFDDEQEPHDPGRSEYVPKGKAKKYARKFEDGDKVWMKIATTDAPELPPIVVFVKEGRYDEETGKEGWVYKVQEKDRLGWYGRERWKREKALKHA